MEFQQNVFARSAGSGRVVLTPNSVPKFSHLYSRVPISGQIPYPVLHFPEPCAITQSNPRSCFPSSSQIPYPIKKFCIFPNLVLYFSQIADPASRVTVKPRIPSRNFAFFESRAIFQSNRGSHFPGSGEIPYPVKKFCVFSNPALYFSQIPDPASQVAVKSRIPSRNFAFFLISRYVSSNSGSRECLSKPC